MSSSSGFQPPLKEPATNTAKLFSVSSLMLQWKTDDLYDLWQTQLWCVDTGCPEQCLGCQPISSHVSLDGCNYKLWAAEVGTHRELAALLSVRTSFIFREVWHCSLRLFLQLIVRGRGCSELLSCWKQPEWMDCRVENVPGAVFAEIAGLEAVKWNLASSERPSLGWNSCEW